MRNVLGRSDNTQALAVIREPTDRFLSIFKYWKHGSDMYRRGNCREVLRHDLERCSVSDTPAEGGGDELLDFMKKWAPRHSDHGGVTATCDADIGASSECKGYEYSEYDLWLPSTWPWYMWEEHFLPQCHWLDKRGGGAEQRVVLVRYSPNKEIFSTRIHAALACLGAPVPIAVQPIRVKNVSGKAGVGEKDNSSSSWVSEEQEQWLRRVFAKDFSMWEQAGRQVERGCSSGELWRAVF